MKSKYIFIFITAFSMCEETSPPVLMVPYRDAISTQTTNLGSWVEMDSTVISTWDVIPMRYIGTDAKVYTLH